MALQLEILSALPRAVSASDLTGRLPGRSLSEIVKEKRRPVAPEEPLSPPKVYALDSSSLSIVPMLTAGNYDEAEYVEDYARNLRPEGKAEVIRRWREGGRWFGLQGSVGERKLLLEVASALAAAVDGYVSVLDPEAGPPIGIYRPEELAPFLGS